MKNGPVVRRCFNVARPSQGGARPLKPLASLRGLIGQSELPACPAAVSTSSTEVFSLRLGSYLPINLREFLIAEFGGGLRIEDDVIYFLRPRAGDLFVRELARAIRRFSYLRAQEHWIEYAIELSQLEADLERQSAPDHHSVLCLECERLTTGQLTEHQDERCVTVLLARSEGDPQLRPSSKGGGIVSGRGLYPQIEEFRKSRQMAGLSHFGLDYYVANQHIVFTWQRPRKPETAKPSCTLVAKDRRAQRPRLSR